MIVEGKTVSIYPFPTPLNQGDAVYMVAFAE
jgi:hypothetical protein